MKSILSDIKQSIREIMGELSVEEIVSNQILIKRIEVINIMLNKLAI